MKFFIAASLFIHGQYSSMTGTMSGDANPPGYSVVNLDIDTIEGPVTVRPSVMGYVNALEVNWVGNLTRKCGNLIESVIADTKLQRANLSSSFFEMPKEPNYGPFPQYNVIVEDAPMQEMEELIGKKPRRKYKSSLVSDLERLISEANHEYIRLETLLRNPREIFTNAIPGQEALNSMRTKLNPFSLFQDHEQYIESNIVPFQEITIHPESAVPKDGFSSTEKWPLLDLNRTMDLVELGMLQGLEIYFEKKIDFIVKTVMPKQTTTTPMPRGNMMSN